MDVIALAQVGFTHAVAALGTAIGEAQLAQLWQFADEPLICLDGDEAGLQAGTGWPNARCRCSNRVSRCGSRFCRRGGTPIRCCVPAAALSAGRRRSSSCSTRRSRSWTSCGRVRSPRVLPPVPQAALGIGTTLSRLARSVPERTLGRLLLNDFFRRLKAAPRGRGGSWRLSRAGSRDRRRLGAPRRGHRHARGFRQRRVSVGRGSASGDPRCHRGRTRGGGIG